MGYGDEGYEGTKRDHRDPRHRACSSLATMGDCWSRRKGHHHACRLERSRWLPRQPNGRDVYSGCGRGVATSRGEMELVTTVVEGLKDLALAQDLPVLAVVAADK